jgi:hypothetical protein
VFELERGALWGKEPFPWSADFGPYHFGGVQAATRLNVVEWFGLAKTGGVFATNIQVNGIGPFQEGNGPVDFGEASAMERIDYTQAYSQQSVDAQGRSIAVRVSGVTGELVPGPTLSYSALYRPIVLQAGVATFTVTSNTKGF